MFITVLILIVIIIVIYTKMSRRIGDVEFEIHSIYRAMKAQADRAANIATTNEAAPVPEQQKTKQPAVQPSGEATGNTPPATPLPVGSLPVSPQPVDSQAMDSQAIDPRLAAYQSRSPKPAKAPPSAQMTPAPYVAPTPIAASTAPVPPEPPKQPKEPSEMQKRWKSIEKQLIENWTGILGSIILVAGITFVGGYAGLSMSPGYRTLMIVGASLVLFAGSYILSRRKNWLSLSNWLRSAGAAVLLFACFASSAIDSLKWIMEMPLALMVLTFGLSVNMLVAWMARSQSFLSVHFVLGMLPIALMPQSQTSMLLATLVTVAALVLAFRQQWMRHSMISLITYGLYHVSWYPVVINSETEVSVKLIAALSALIVGGQTVLAQYRTTATSKELKPLPFFVHLGSWALIASTIAVYTGDTLWRGSTLLAVSILLFLYSRFIYARRSSDSVVRWVYLTDTLVSQSLAIFGIISFYPFVAHWLMIPAAIFGQSCLYLKLMLDESESFLQRSGVYFAHAASAALALIGLSGASFGQEFQVQSAIILAISALTAAAMHLYLLARKGEAYDSVAIYVDALDGNPESIQRSGLSLLGLSSGCISIACLFALSGGQWLGAGALGLSSILIWASKRWNSLSLKVSTLLTLVAGFLMIWVTLFRDHPAPALPQIIYSLTPLLLAGAIAIYLAGSDRLGRLIRTITIYMTGLHLAFAAYLLLQPLSPLAPGLVWLLLSLIALEIANRAKSEDSSPILNMGYAYLAGFAGTYFLIIMQLQTYWGAVPARAYIELFTLGVLSFWWSYRPGETLGKKKNWSAIHPLFLELLLVFGSIVLTVELSETMRALSWSFLSIMLLAPVIVRLDSRLRFYSMVLYWVSIADLLMVTSGAPTIATEWYTHPGVIGIFAILLNVVYIILATSRLELSKAEFPKSLSLFAALSASLSNRLNLALYYPFFFGVALFLYWRFDAAVLTLLWAVEAFVVFVIGLYLREKDFRHLAMIALGACSVRLILYDMAQSNLGMRGAVFIGVGLLMLGMNALNNKYKERLDN